MAVAALFGSMIVSAQSLEAQSSSPDGPQLFDPRLSAAASPETGRDKEEWLKRAVQKVNATEPDVHHHGERIDHQVARRPAADVMDGPILSNPAPPVPLPTGALTAADRPLPINLATALRLSDARPLLIAAAQARIQIAAAQLEQTRALWLPNVNAGAAYISHGGGNQVINGALIDQATGFFQAGGSLEFRFAMTDAIFAPLAARQELRARQVDLQTARNDVLMETAIAYFNVQQARGTYAVMVDAVDKSKDLVRRVQSLSQGLASPDEVQRASTQLADLEQAVATARQKWRVASAELTRVLRLNPSSVIAPLEPDHLQVTLIDPRSSVDELIPVGLTNRPELESRQALVQATLARLKQERLRPLIPSILVTGNGTPDFLYQGGIFGTGTNGSVNQWAGRSDVAIQSVWKLDNLGFGYQGRVRERRGQVQLAMVELFNVQDHVAAQVAQAKAEVESAATRVRDAENGLKHSVETYQGNLKGLGQTVRFGDVLSLVNRPQEVVAALAQLQRAYDNYYSTVADFNRAQFRLFHALGFPSAILSHERPPGEVLPVDTERSSMAPAIEPHVDD